MKKSKPLTQDELEILKSLLLRWALCKYPGRKGDNAAMELVESIPYLACEIFRDKESDK